MSSNSQPFNGDSYRDLLEKYTSTALASEVPDVDAKLIAGNMVMSVRKSMLSGSAETIPAKNSPGFSINVSKPQKPEKNNKTTTLRKLMSDELQRQKSQSIRDATSLARIIVAHEKQELESYGNEIYEYRSSLSSTEQEEFDQDVLRWSQSLTVSKIDYLSAAQELPDVFFEGIESRSGSRAERIERLRAIRRAEDHE